MGYFANEFEVKECAMSKSRRLEMGEIIFAQQNMFALKPR